MAGKVENKTKYALRCKTRTKHYGLGIKCGLTYKTRTEHYRLCIKRKERYKIPISYQVITVHQGNGTLAPQMSLGKTVHVLSPKMAGNGQVILEVRAAIVSHINSSFLAKFRFPIIREDVSLLKTFTITMLSVRETELSSPERPREL